MKVFFLFLVLFYFVFGKDAVTSLKKKTLFNLLAALGFVRPILINKSLRTVAIKIMLLS